MHLMNLERLSAAERLAEALKTRGLFVIVNQDMITLTSENTTGDIHAVRKLLASIGVPVLWLGENQFQLLVNRFPVAGMKRIIYKKGREFPVSMRSYHYRWRSFAQRRFGIKVNALDMEANMAVLVKSLNYAGITSLAGCNGHNRHQPTVQLSGVYNGAWLEVVQHTLLEVCSLHYVWKVDYGNQSGASFVASKAETEKWNMHFIYQDTAQMGLILQQHAGPIRQLKREAFSRGGETKRIAETLAGEKQYSELVEWMKKQARPVRQEEVF